MRAFRGVDRWILGFGTRHASSHGTSTGDATTEEFDLEEGEPTMLVLSRKVAEKIVIGEGIVLTVVKVDRNQVRIGIEAPPEVPVYREEIAPSRRAAAAAAELCPVG
jgi:carbon storage regulator